MSDNSPTPPHSSTSKKQKSWTVLVIGELGNIFSFPVTKRLIVTLGICFVAVLTLAVLCMVHYLGIRAENDMLKDDLAKSKTALIAANKARETALIRLSLLEAGANADEKTDQPLPEPKPAAEKPHVEEPPTVDEKDAEDVVATGQEPVVEPSSDVSAEPSEPSPDRVTQPSEEITPVATRIVSVEELKISKEAEDASVTFQFIVKNTDPEGNRVKGYTFVILRPEEGFEGPVAVFPPSPLKDGKPTTFEKGQYFSILRYKYVRGSFPETETVEDFSTATVYVYSDTGELLLEEVFEVDDVQRI